MTDATESTESSESNEPRDATASQHAESELATPVDPEIGPPVPASALAAGAARGLRDSEDAVAATPGRDSIAEILRLAWPVMASQVLLNLTGLVDRMMIGRLAADGSAAIPLAAVGYATQLFFLIHSTLIAVGLACVAVMARAIGAGDATRARHAFAASVQVSALVALLYGTVLFFGGERILEGLGAEPAVVEIAIPYLQLTVTGALMLSFTMMGESALRANRNTRTPMLIAACVAAVKLALNGIFIFGLLGAPRLELLGAGLATVLSQAIGLILFSIVLLRIPSTAATGLRLGDVFRANPVVREVVRIALPGVAERIVLNLGLLAYFWILSRWYGTLTVAVYTVGLAILSFAWIPGTGYAQACATLVGQALGARRPEAAVRAGKRAAALAIATAIPLGVLCLWVRFPLARLFTEDAVVVAALGPFMLMLALAQPFLQLHFTLGGALRGAGDTVTPLISAMIGNWLVRVPMAIFVAGYLELDVVWVWAVLILDHVVRSSFLGVAFVRGRWTESRGRAG